MSNSGRATSPTFPGRRPLYYYITDRRSLAGRPLLGCIRRQVSHGVDFIQIREKDLTDRDLYRLALRVRLAAAGTATQIILNGRADLAVAAGANGVHLPADGIDPADIRRWIPPGFIIGVSVHSKAEALRAASSGADYVLLGHVFPTPSKEGLGPPLGLATLGEVCAAVKIPVLALGGMRPEDTGSVLDVGAAGVAGISLFQHCIDFRCPSAQNRTQLSRQSG